MNLTTIFNNFITSGIQTYDQETITKVKVLNTFLSILIIFFPCLGLFYLFVGAKLLFYVTCGAGILGISALIALRKTKNLILAGNYAFFLIWAASLVIRWNTGAMSEGGVVLLSWIWNAALILMAIYITGYLGGTVWGSLVFVETGIAIYLFRRGYEFPNLIPAHISPIYSMGAYLLGLLAILLIAFMYENEKEKVIEREQVKSKGLAESCKLIDTIVEKVPFPTFVIDREHRVIQWNRACEVMTGVNAGETIGRKVPDSLCVDDKWSLADMIIEEPDSIMDRFSDSIVSKTDTGSFEIEVSLPAIREGIQAIVNVSPIVDTNGSIKGAIEIIQDVNNFRGGICREDDDKGMEIALTSRPVFRINSKGKISFWNKACEENFGYSSSKMIGNNPFTFVSQSTRKPFRETIIRVFKGESFDGKEWKYYSPKGNPIYVLARAQPFQGTDGKTEECIVVNTDITNLTLRMQKFERDAIEAKEKLKSVTDEYALLRRNIASYIRKKEE